MSPDKKNSASIPRSVAFLCGAIILILLIYSLLTGISVPAPSAQSAGQEITACAATSGVSRIEMPVTGLPPAVCPASVIQQPGSIIPVTVESTTLSLARPDPVDRINYTGRGFPEQTNAAIAWWMFPGFDDANREYRRYLRGSLEDRATYPAEEQRFFTFITKNLDCAEQAVRVRHETRLFRGITPSVASLVMNSSQWREAPFASTSYDITVTLDPYANPDAGGYENVLVLSRQPGDHVLYLNEDQREFLLPRNTAWDVIRIEEVRNLTVDADFVLHNRMEKTASFHNVRLIWLRESSCVA